MPNTFRAALATLINLSLITAAFAQSNSDTSTPMRALTAEEDSLRTLTTEYGRALAAGDLEAVRKFWNPESSNLSPVLRNYKKIFAQARLEFISPQITQLEISGDKAISQLTAYWCGRRRDWLLVGHVYRRRSVNSCQSMES